MDYYDYGYNDYYDVGYGLGSILGGFLIFFAIIALIILAVWIVNLIATWKVYKKAGYGGWEAIVPFYSDWILVKASGLNWWWYLFIIIPIVLPFIPVLSIFSFFGSLAMIFAKFNCYFNLSKRFNKGTGFAICLTLFTPICMAILGFSKNNVCNASVVVSNNGVFGTSSNNSNMNNTNNMNNMNNMNNNYNNQQFDNNNLNNVNPSIQEQPINNMQAQPFSFCGNCGTKLENGTKFCPNCGNQNI